MTGTIHPLKQLKQEFINIHVHNTYVVSHKVSRQYKYYKDKSLNKMNWHVIWGAGGSFQRSKSIDIRAFNNK